MSAGQEIGSPIRENRALLPASLPPDEARATLAAAAGVSTVGLRPPFDTPAAAFSSCLSRLSHLDRRARNQLGILVQFLPDSATGCFRQTRLRYQVGERGMKISIWVIALCDLANLDHRTKNLR